jgi:hypothetical protein
VEQDGNVQQSDEELARVTATYDELLRYGTTSHKYNHFSF